MSRNAKSYKDAGKMVVTSRKGRVSRNVIPSIVIDVITVTSRKGRVSRNRCRAASHHPVSVTSRKGRVSRNMHQNRIRIMVDCHVPQGACE